MDELWAGMAARGPILWEESGLAGLIARGGPAMAVIAALSILSLAVILWKLWRFVLDGAWARRRAERLTAAHLAGSAPRLPAGGGIRLRFAGRVIGLVREGRLRGAGLREEVERVALAELRGLRRGFRLLDLVVTIAPLVGLLGTVLGMIEAFQALQDSGAAADPGVLAGGIWEALLTTAAGMAVAIPAAVALSWFESVTETVQHDMEDLATRILLAEAPDPVPGADAMAEVAARVAAPGAERAA